MTDRSNVLQLFDDLPPHIEAALRASIERFGVLVPVVKDQHGRTLDGHHRGRIAEELSVKYRVDIVSVQDDDEAREISRTLNADRRQLTEDQRREVAAELRREGHSVRAIAGALGVGKSTVDRDLDELSRAGQLDVPERSVGLDGKSRPARRPPVVGARDVNEAQRAQDALEILGPDSQIEGFMTATEARRAAARAMPAAVPEPIPPPAGRYRCIVIDPPWPMQKIDRDERPDQGIGLDYPVLSLEDIARDSIVPVRAVADDDCHIYLWVTHRFLPAGLALLEAWGFRYQCVMTWRKNVGITPYSWMYDTEHVLFGRRGNLPLEQLGLRLSFEAPVVGHSIKPDVFYERVRQASPGPRLEMFPGVEHEGFEPWGLEASHREVTANA